MSATSPWPVHFPTLSRPPSCPLVPVVYLHSASFFLMSIQFAQNCRGIRIDSCIDILHALSIQHFQKSQKRLLSFRAPYTSSEERSVVFSAKSGVHAKWGDLLFADTEPFGYMHSTPWPPTGSRRQVSQKVRVKSSCGPEGVGPLIDGREARLRPVESPASRECEPWLLGPWERCPAGTNEAACSAAAWAVCGHQRKSDGR